MNSRRTFDVLLIVATVVVCTVQLAYCTETGRRGGDRFYNPATEITVSGIVEEVRTMRRKGRGGGGIHLDLKTDSGSLDVHLGPSAFLARNKFSFARNDRIEVTGSKVRYQGHDAIIAREVRTNGRTLTLRDTQGIPEWSGRRRR
jgi:hypothetical protein